MHISCRPVVLPCALFRAHTTEAALNCAGLPCSCPSLLSWRPAYRESVSLARHTCPRVQRINATTKQQTPNVAFKRQVVQQYLAGETLDVLADRHNLSRDLIRTWVDKYLYPSQGGTVCEAGVCNERAEAAHTIGEYEAAALERLVGKPTR